MSEIEYWSEYPFKIRYKVIPAVKGTKEQPGQRATVEVEFIAPTHTQIVEWFNNNFDEKEIETACWQDYGERKYPA